MLLRERPPIRSLRYGSSGRGKTVMSASWPIDPDSGEWVFVFDFDDGLASIRDSRGKLPKGYFSQTFVDRNFKPGSAVSAMDGKGAPGSQFMQRQATAFDEAKALMEALQRGLNGPERERLGLPDGYDEYPTVIIVDTISGLHDCAGNKALSLSGKYSLGGGLAQHHYPTQMHFVKEFTFLAENGNWHLDMTAHEVASKDDMRGMHLWTIVVTGTKTPGFYPGYFDEFYRHDVTLNGEYFIRTASDNQASAKTGLGFDLFSGTAIFDAEEPLTVMPGQPWGWAYLLNKADAYYDKKGGE